MERIDEAKLARISRAFAGKGRKTNKHILKMLVLEGPQTPYSLFKKQRENSYSMINVHMREMTKDGYLAVVGLEQATKSKQNIKRYGLTLKGLILSLLLDRDVGKETRVLYAGKVKQILDSNRNVPFCRFFSDAINKNALDEGVVKNIFFDKLREFASAGYSNLDVINDYFLFKHARTYISHTAQKQIDDLPEESRTLVSNILIDFRRLSHPDTTLTLLQPYLDESEKRDFREE